MSLFRLTYERIAPLAGRRGIVVVAGAEHRSWVRRQTPEVAAGRLLLEGMGRNTAASVAAAALWVRARSPDGIMVVLPSDHFITPVGAFLAALVFGFANTLQTQLSILNVPIPSFFLLMTPYIVTIAVVAGLVRRARPPAADGKPYVKR